MAALEWFESIRDLQKRVTRLEGSIEAAYAAAGPHGQRMGSIGGGGRTDSLAAVDRIVDSDAMAELDRARGELLSRMDRATEVLYGRSGRGGLAKARSSADADILCCRYLQGMGWAEIAREIVRPSTGYPVQWCYQRALRACTYIDRVGMDALAES